jgi:hypothetical protein
MNKKKLDIAIYILAVTILLTLAIQYIFNLNKASDIVYNHQVVETINETSPTPSPIIDKEIPCNNKYFSTTVNSTWNYNLSVPESKEFKLKKNDINFEIKIIESTGSSILLKTTINNKSDKSKLSCRVSGIYGLPFSVKLLTQILGENITNLQDLDMIQYYLFIPAENKIILNGKWSQKITVIPNILGFVILNTVNSPASAIFDNIIRQGFNVTTSIDAGQNIKNVQIDKTPVITKSELMSYTLLDTVGISKLQITRNNVKIKLILKNFKN